MVEKLLRIAGASVPVAALVLVLASVAWALTDSTGIVLKNGAIGLEGTTAGSIATTTTNAAANLMGTTADYDLFYGSSSGEAVSVLAKGTANQVLKMAGDGNSFAWGTDATGAANPILSLTSETKIQLDSGESTFLGLGGRIGTFAQIGTPVSAYTFTNLYCVTDSAPNATNATAAMAATFVYGTCGGTPSESGTISIADVDETSEVDSGTQAVGAGECVGLKVAVSTANADSVFLNCTLERSAS